MTSVANEPFLFTPEMSAPSSGTASRSPAASGGESVDHARQEISQIVREVAAAQRSERGRDQYLRFLADRILRAMAAHGVVIWHAPDDVSSQSEGMFRYRAEHRIGAITDQQFDNQRSVIHDRLLLEVAGQNSPVVVPPTPGAAEPDVPANPTEYPAAMVPIPVDPTLSLPSYLLEVFLEPGGSPASQRGSLRFLAQMGNLASEFLRTDQLRVLSRRLGTFDQCTRAIDELARLTSTRRIEAGWVDAVSRLMDCPRAALCRVDRGRTEIVAVSHVERIDQHSDAANAIRRAAETALRCNSLIAFASLQPDRRSGVERRSGSSEEHSSAHPPAVLPRWVVALGPESRWRLVLLESSDASASEDTDLGTDQDTEFQWLLHRLLLGGHQAWMAAHRIEAIPGARLWNRLTTTDCDELSESRLGDDAAESRGVYSPLRRRLGLLTAIALTTTLLMCLPIPSLVPASGLIRPLELDTYHATADSTVQTLHVHHGQSVRRGDTLATLVSSDLTERKTNLLGRRSVLMQRRERANRALVSASDPAKGLPDGMSEQEITEEVVAIDRQLKIIADCQDELVLKARRDGRVDAWRLQERLSGRPLRRGDAVLSVIAEDTTWVIDATIPQRRVSRIDHAIVDERFTAEVSTRWRPGEVQPATAHRFGPVVTDSVDGTPGVILRMTLASAPRLGDQPLAETPARVAIRCGHTSIGWFLLEDVIQWLQTRVGVYL